MSRVRCCNKLLLFQRSVFGISIAVLFLTLSVNVHANELKNARIRLVNGSSIRATIEAIDADGNISGSRIIRDIKLGQITSIETEQGTDSAAVCKIQLIHGGFVNANEVTVENDLVNVTDQSEHIQRIPIESIQGIIWKNSKFVANTIKSRSTEKDTVVVVTKRGEQKVQGFLEGIDETHVVLNYQGKNRRIARSKVNAVLTAKLDDEKPGGIIAVVSTTAGSQLQGRFNEFVDGKLRLTISSGFAMEVDASTIAKIVIQSDRIQYLSDIEPIRHEQQTQFSANRTWQRDKSLLGNSLRLKYDSSGKVLSFDKGIGTRSYTSIVFNNENDFDQLRAVVGIDMETEGHGDCEMVVEGDGIRLWSKRVTGNSDPEPIVLDIKGITEVALIVLPGANFDLADHANWADVRFTKSN